MKKLVFLFACILCHTVLFAQQFSVSGNIINQHKKPVEFVYAALLQNDSVPVKEIVTDSLGSFSIKAAKGNYQLVVSQFGKELLRRQITLNNDMNLGSIAINETTSLQGVIVTAGKKLLEQKVDRLIFNVENSTAATGGTALDALKATPTVRVQNDAVSIVGKGEVLVMIDDRLQRMSQDDLANFLKSIPAANIKSIEVITAPPARYDAEGNSGIINIKLKTARKNSWNATVGTSYTQRSYASGNVQALFNYNRNKLTLQASVNTGKEKLRTNTESNIFYPAEQWKLRANNVSETNMLSLVLGADYKLKKNWISGLHYLGSFTDRSSANTPLTTRFGAGSQDINAYVASAVNASGKPNINSLNWYHNIALDSAGKNISIDFDHFYYRKKDGQFFEGNELDKNKAIIPNTFFSSSNSNLNCIRNYSGKIDITLPYKWANLSFGGKFSFTNTNNDLVVYDRSTGSPVYNPDQSNLFVYKEYNEALYFSASKKLNEKWETQLGLRMEATQTKGFSETLNQTDKNNYVQLFPTAYVTYTKDKNNSFSLNYSRRIRRPDFDYLNPFTIRTNPYFYSEGNPFLKPSYIDNLEFSFVKNQNWVSSLYYSGVSNFGQQLSIVDASTNITKQTPLNYANTYQLGLSTYYNFGKLWWWKSFTGFNVNYQHVQSKTSFVQSTDGYNGYIYTNNDFTLNKSKTVFAALNYAVQLPGRYQIFHISNMHMLDLSVKFLMNDKKLALTVTGEDLLNAQRPLITYNSNGIKNDVRSYNDSRALRVSLSYKLGKNNLKAKQRNFGNEEERNRAN